ATYANGDVYEGAFVRGRREGPGTMRYATGTETTGDWADGALLTPAPAPEPATEGEAPVNGDAPVNVDTAPAEPAPAN
ncbi:MAG: hypothetical protein ACI87T_004000, partial [Planctomycetota bacterium]